MADATFIVTAEAPVVAAPRPRWDAAATVAAGRAGVFPPSVVRLEWSPLRGVGLLEIHERSLVYRATRTRRAFAGLRREARFEPEEALVEESGPSQRTELAAPLTALLIRLVVRDRATDAIRLAVAVRNRHGLLDLLEERGWEVRRASGLGNRTSRS
jgi:hypothetical protein